MQVKRLLAYCAAGAIISGVGIGVVTATTPRGPSQDIPKAMLTPLATGPQAQEKVPFSVRTPRNLPADVHFLRTEARRSTEYDEASNTFKELDTTHIVHVLSFMGKNILVTQVKADKVGSSAGVPIAVSGTKAFLVTQDQTVSLTTSVDHEGYVEVISVGGAVPSDVAIKVLASFLGS